MKFIKLTFISEPLPFSPATRSPLIETLNSGSQMSNVIVHSKHSIPNNLQIEFANGIINLNLFIERCSSEESSQSLSEMVFWQGFLHEYSTSAVLQTLDSKISNLLGKIRIENEILSMDSGSFGFHYSKNVDERVWQGLWRL